MDKHNVIKVLEEVGYDQSEYWYGDETNIDYGHIMEIDKRDLSIDRVIALANRGIKFHEIEGRNFIIIYLESHK